MNYKDKYIKYKSKYMDSKNSLNQNSLNQTGGKKNKMVQIIFVRHGQSTENVASTKGFAYDSNNIILTTEGEEQAIKTGKYLFTTFGKFDHVISSPITRCVQTSNLIIEQINFDVSKIVTDDLIMEIGGQSHPFDGLSKKERDKIKNADTQFCKIEKDMARTTNPYIKYNLEKKIVKHISKNSGIKPNIYNAHDNLLNFMDRLKNIIKENNYEKILVVSHGGILSLMQKIICGVNPEKTIYLSEKKYTSEDELLGNCACLYLGLENDKFILVAPANTNHLI